MMHISNNHSSTDWYIWFYG